MAVFAEKSKFVCFSVNVDDLCTMPMGVMNFVQLAGPLSLGYTPAS